MNETARDPARPRPTTDASPARPFVVRLPGFVADEQIGLGDAVRRVTTKMGLRTCGGCERRAATLNHWIVFAGQRPG